MASSQRGHVNSNGSFVRRNWRLVFVSLAVCTDVAAIVVSGIARLFPSSTPSTRTSSRSDEAGLIWCVLCPRASLVCSRSGTLSRHIPYKIQQTVSRSREDLSVRHRYSFFVILSSQSPRVSTEIHYSFFPLGATLLRNRPVVPPSFPDGNATTRTWAPQRPHYRI